MPALSYGAMIASLLEFDPNHHVDKESFREMLQSIIEERAYNPTHRGIRTRQSLLRLDELRYVARGTL